MSNPRRRKGLAWLAVLALGAAMSVTQVTPGLADPSAVAPAGQLTLHMSTDGHRFSYTPAFAGGSVINQPISQSGRCGYSSGTDLVRVTAEGGSVGFSTSNAQLGVDSRDGAAKCTQVNVAPEKLILEINNDPGSTLEGLYATNASLDVELKFNPQVTITGFKEGVSVGSFTYDCSPVSDCGPDRDAAGDNTILDYPPSGTVLFDKLEISAAPTGGSTTSAGISLEGGNDLYPDGTHDSIFFIAQPFEPEGSICPGQTIHEPTGTGVVDVEYLGTTGPCKQYLLTYSRDPATNERTLEYLLTAEGTPGTFEVRFNAWDPEPAGPVPLTRVIPPSPYHPVEWCEGTASIPTIPSGEAWCLVNQNTSTYGPDGDGTPGNPDWVPGYEGQLMQVSETLLLIGDAGCKR